MEKLNRVGRFCGGCDEGYGLSAYSYQFFSCVSCKDYGYKNWLIYFAVSLLPLTVFYVLAVMLSLNVTSSGLNGVILIIQCLSSPLQMTIMQGSPDFEYFGVPLKILLTLTGAANLDFFRVLYSPNCLHPRANALEILALDYIVAIYPFLLIFVTYSLVTAYDKQYRLLIYIWWPFKVCIQKYRGIWDVGTSLLNIFATISLLSSVKILGTSFAILSYKRILDITGSELDAYYLLYDSSNISSERYFFTALAVLMSSIFVLLPIFLLALYPCGSFQKFLNCCGGRWQQPLHVVMDAFQGCYRTHPRDLRYFSVFYWLLRVLLLAQLSLFTSTLMFYTSGILSMIAASLVAIFQPYRIDLHNKVDTVLLLLMAIYFLSYFVNASVKVHDWHLTLTTSSQVIAVVVLSAYYVLLILWQVLIKKIWSLWHKET